jgi:hypothetical protein
MKIVLDTNVVVSGLLRSQGNPVRHHFDAPKGPARPHLGKSGASARVPAASHDTRHDRERTSTGTRGYDIDG